MVTMQNLQTQAADILNASAQVSSGTGATSQKEGTASFVDILSSTVKASSDGSQKVTEKNSSKDSQSKKTDGDNKAQAKDDKGTDKSDKVKDAKKSDKTDSKKDAAAEKAAEETAAVSTGSELIAMMAMASGQAQNVAVEEVTVQVAEAPVEQVVETVAEVVQTADVMTDRTATAQDAVQVQTQAGTQQSFEAGMQQTAAADKAVNNNETVHTEVRSDAQTQTSTVTQNTAARNNSQDGAQAQAQTGSRTETVETVARTTDGPEAEVELTPENVPQHVTTPNVNNVNNLVTIQVSEGAQLQQQIVTQVADTITAKMSENVQEFSITITPENLGRIDIKIVFADGKAQVMMSATEQATQRALLGNENAIRQIIESNTGQETEVLIQHRDEQDILDHGNEEQRQGRQQDGRDQHNSEHDTTSFIQQLRLGLVGDEAAEEVL